MSNGNPEQFYDKLADNYDSIYPDWQAAVQRQSKTIKRMIDSLKGEADTLFSIVPVVLAHKP